MTVRTNLAAFYSNPLTTQSAGMFMRLCLAEAAGHGMPPQTIAMIDEIAALAGYVPPLDRGMLEYLAAPMVVWRMFPEQPLMQIDDLLFLAAKQRALIAFGGYRDNMMVGTAEILVAIGNTCPTDAGSGFAELYMWAGLDALTTMYGVSEDIVLAEKARTKQNWRRVSDDEVLKPGGVAHQAYQKCATNIRREAIAMMRRDSDHPRKIIAPLAESTLRHHIAIRDVALAAGLDQSVKAMDAGIARLRELYPSLPPDARLRSDIGPLNTSDPFVHAMSYALQGLWTRNEAAMTELAAKQQQHAAGAHPPAPADSGPEVKAALKVLLDAMADPKAAIERKAALHSKLDDVIMAMRGELALLRTKGAPEPQTVSSAAAAFVRDNPVLETLRGERPA